MIEPLESRIAPAAGQVFVVSTLQDITDSAHDTGSLRDALLNANANPGADFIVFQKVSAGKTVPLTGTIVLKDALGSLPSITDDLTITGPVAGKANGIILDGHHHSLLNIGSNTNSALSASLSDLTLRHGQNQYGGGLAFYAPDGTLSLTDVTITANRAVGGPGQEAMGGGIAIGAGTVSISNSIISGNSCLGGPGTASSPGKAAMGGGIVCFGKLTLDQSTVSGNIAQGGNASRLSDGFAGGGGYGGGILSGKLDGFEGSVTVHHSVISGNKALGGNGSAGFHPQSGSGNPYGHSGGNGGGGYGGGLGDADGTLTITDSKVLNNLAKGGNGGAGTNGVSRGANGGDGGAGQTGCGGGVASVGSTNSLEIQSSVISGNKSVSGKPGMSGVKFYGYYSYRQPGRAYYSVGGGVFSTQAAAISETTISKNSAEFGGGATLGGGLVQASTFSNNAATKGGGIFVTQGQTQFQNTTIALNKATLDGGGISVSESAGLTLSLHNCTVAKNSAKIGGGLNVPATLSAELISSIVALNRAKDSPDIQGPVSGGHNLVLSYMGIVGAFATDPTNVFQLDPKLGALADHGGPTATMLPLLTATLKSPAIDAGANPDSQSYDQRGASYARLLGAALDIGAVEVG